MNPKSLAAPRSGALLLATLVAAACGDSPTTPPEPPRYTVANLGPAPSLAGLPADSAFHLPWFAGVIDADGRVLANTSHPAFEIRAPGTPRFGLAGSGAVTWFPPPGYARALSERGGRITGIDPAGRPFLFSAGQLTPLASPGLENAVPFDVNEEGAVVGTTTTITPPGGRAFLWKAGQLQLLDFPGEAESRATVVNTRGHVAGSGSRRVCQPIPQGTSCTGESRAFLWRDGRVVALGELAWRDQAPPAGGYVGPVQYAPVDLNDAGQVVGTATRSVCEPAGCTATTRAFLWQDGRMREILADQQNPRPAAINNRGQVIGTTATRPFLWEDGHEFDLRAAVDGSGVRLESVADINDRGQIAATGRVPGASGLRNLLLTPLP
jgi:probable HAF family extracellular repeat protein